MDVLQLISSTAQSNPLAACGLLFLAAFLENVLPPLPGDMVTVLGGYLVGAGFLALPLVAVAVTAGSWAGFMALFALGRLLGRSRIHAVVGAMFPHRELERSERWFRRWGYSLVLANRFLAGTRSVISLFAGIADLDVPRVALFALLSCGAWNTLLLAAGMAIGEEWERLETLLVTYNWFVLGGLAAAVLLWWLWWRRQALS